MQLQWFLAIANDSVTKSKNDGPYINILAIPGENSVICFHLAGK